MAHGRVGVGESDGFESFLRGCRGEFHLFVVESRVDGQHGPVIDVHVQVAYFATRLIIFIDEFFGMQVERACESSQFEILVQLVDGDVSFAFKASRVGFAEVREQVGAFERPHLLSMFQHSFESVVP